MCKISVHVKNPTTIKEQVNLLKSRGCLIDDECFAEKILSRINYYRFTAYFLPFKESPDGVNYVKDTSFKKIYSIYEFDREIRGLLMSIIEEIEIMIRTQISYYHAHKYGALGYEDVNNFNKRHNHNNFIKKIKGVIKDNKNLLFVRHHIERYNNQFPIWVISELLTIGDIYYFYSDMHTSDRKNFAKKYYNTTEENLKSWFVCLRHIRNCCAHFSRLYNMDLMPTPKTPKNFPLILKKKLFDYLLVLSFLYPDKETWEEKIFNRIEEILDKYSDYINLADIGFTQDWDKYLSCKHENI